MTAHAYNPPAPHVKPQPYRWTIWRSKHEGGSEKVAEGTNRNETQARLWCAAVLSDHSDHAGPAEAVDRRQAIRGWRKGATAYIKIDLPDGRLLQATLEPTDPGPPPDAHLDAHL